MRADSAGSPRSAQHARALLHPAETDGRCTTKPNSHSRAFGCCGAAALKATVEASRSSAAEIPRSAGFQGLGFKGLRFRDWICCLLNAGLLTSRAVSQSRWEPHRKQTLKRTDLESSAAKGADGGVAVLSVCCCPLSLSAVSAAVLCVCCCPLCLPYSLSVCRTHSLCAAVLSLLLSSPSLCCPLCFSGVVLSLFASLFLSAVLPVCRTLSLCAAVLPVCLLSSLFLYCYPLPLCCPLSVC